MDQRLLAGGVALMGAYAMPSPSVMAVAWLGSRPSFFLLLVLAAVAFAVLVGGALGI